jgi:phosphoglycolate phosphatase-like HAD superfamily hydrolase
VHGVTAAKAAGAICVAVQTRHVSAERIGMADARIGSVGELLALLGT